MVAKKDKPAKPGRQYPNPWLEGERARYERERPFIETMRAAVERHTRGLQELQEERERARRDEETAKAKERQAEREQIAAAVAAAIAPLVPPRSQATSLKELVCGDKHKCIRGLADDIPRNPHDQPWIDWARALLPRVHAAGWQRTTDHSLAKDLPKWFGAKK
jgi:hypothetical protein